MQCTARSHSQLKTHHILIRNTHIKRARLLLKPNMRHFALSCRTCIAQDVCSINKKKIKWIQLPNIIYNERNRWRPIIIIMSACTRAHEIRYFLFLFRLFYLIRAESQRRLILDTISLYMKETNKKQTKSHEWRKRENRRIFW